MRGPNHHKSTGKAGVDRGKRMSCDLPGIDISGMGGYNTQGFTLRTRTCAGEKFLEQLFQMRRVTRIKHACYCACTHHTRINPLIVLLYLTIGHPKRRWIVSELNFEIFRGKSCGNSTKTEYFPGKQEVNHRQCLATFIVRWNNQVHKAGHVVCVAQRNNGNSALDCFVYHLGIADRVSDNNYLWFDISIENRVCQQSRNKSSGC